MIRPRGPVPVTSATSIPFSLAILRANGLANTRVPALGNGSGFHAVVLQSCTWHKMFAPLERMTRYGTTRRRQHARGPSGARNYLPDEAAGGGDAVAAGAAAAGAGATAGGAAGAEAGAAAAT